MEELEREYLISYYDKRVGFLGETPAALGWSEKGQLARYETALRFFADWSAAACPQGSCPEGYPLDGASIADYGCGMGDFYGFLLRKGISGINYSGFDINPGLIRIARARYLDKNGNQRVFFDVLDIDGGDGGGLPGFYDYSLICGVFNQRVDGASESAKRCIEKMWSRTGKVLVFDALSCNQKEKDAALEYCSPEEMVEFAAVKIPGARASLHEGLVEGALTLCLSRK